MKIIFTIQITAPLLLLLERAPLPLPPDFFQATNSGYSGTRIKITSWKEIVEKVGLQATPLEIPFFWKGRKGSPRRWRRRRRLVVAPSEVKGGEGGGGGGKIGNAGKTRKKLN